MAYKDPEKARASARAYYFANREKRLRQCKEWQHRNPELVLEYYRTRDAKRRERMQADSAYYARERARSRKARAKKRILDGKPYYPHFRKRIPDSAVFGQQLLDANSPFLWNNLTDSQRAYARELAIERRAAW